MFEYQGPFALESSPPKVPRRTLQVTPVSSHKVTSVSRRNMTRVSPHVLLRGLEFVEREETSSSCLSPLIEEPKMQATSDRTADITAAAARIFDDASGAKVAEMIGWYGVEWVARAVAVAETRRPRPTTWGYVVATLKNFRRSGGPPPEAPTLPSAPEPRVIAPPAVITEPAPSPVDQVVTELVALCALVGESGRHARRTLHRAVERGEIGADQVPAAVLAQAKMENRSRGLSPNIPPRPAGASSCRSHYTVQETPYTVEDACAAPESGNATTASAENRDRPTDQQSAGQSGTVSPGAGNVARATSREPR